MDQHLKSALHKKNTASKVRQTTISEAISQPEMKDAEDRDEFTADMCRMMVAANIPWNKLQNPVVKEVLGKYTGRNIPDESTLRKNYLPSLYDKVSTFEHILSELHFATLPSRQRGNFDTQVIKCRNIP